MTDEEPTSRHGVRRIETWFAITRQAWRVAIDAGTMIEDSKTCQSYGVTGFPTQVIISRDGLISYNSEVPPPGLEDIHGKPCDEVTAEDTAKIEAFERELFEAAGETWPLAADLSESEQNDLFMRANVFHVSRRIEETLAQDDGR